MVDFQPLLQLARSDTLKTELTTSRYELEWFLFTIIL